MKGCDKCTIMLSEMSYYARQALKLESKGKPVPTKLFEEIEKRKKNRAECEHPHVQ